jgi:hypothetical protein
MNSHTLLLLVGLATGILLAALGMKFESEFMRGLGAFVLLFLILILPTFLGRNS